MFSLVYITAGDMEEARKIGKKLVEERLAACVNFFPVTSIFRWKGLIDEANEVAIIAKTTSGKVKDIDKRVKELHSYDVPCVVSFNMEEGSKDFLDWIAESVE
ncbi:MAG: divalent-cation tolerance protein CutA [Candidatus Methanoperedens sp.]|jgi:periplasmic divalent cation tolerance protein|nr:divalent-cation tolerance protein CutA [Candidatus Methanoperedens sp.]PKL54640.1 MAG: divalent-cation tolerance protein CutA [Candidatus Methanoperedenaceae archaeon HGW-Methanoperedenaceae-1]